MGLFGVQCLTSGVGDAGGRIGACLVAMFARVRGLDRASVAPRPCIAYATFHKARHECVEREEVAPLPNSNAGARIEGQTQGGTGGVNRMLCLRIRRIRLPSEG